MTEPVQKDTRNDGYLIPAPLVNKAILSIIGGIVLIAGYMVVWAINDAAFKATVLGAINKIPVIESKQDAHERKPCHDVACERFRELGKREIVH